MTDRDFNHIVSSIYKYSNIVKRPGPIWMKTPEDMNDYIIPDIDGNEGCYCDFKLFDIKYNYRYLSEHTLSKGAPYYVTNVFRKAKYLNIQNSDNEVFVKIQFFPGCHTVIVPLKTFLCGNIYYPYGHNIYGYCCIGNMDGKELINNREMFEFWLQYVGRLFNCQHEYYPAFGGFGYMPIDLRFRCFEDFFKCNNELRKAGKLTMCDINDQGLYTKFNYMKPNYRDTFSYSESLDLDKLPILDDHENIPLPMRIREIPIWQRDKKIIKKAGRPKGSTNKPKPEPEKVQMYRLIDNTKD